MDVAGYCWPDLSLSVSEYLDTVHRRLGHRWVPDFSTDALTGQCRLPLMYQVDNSLLVPAPPRSHIESPSPSSGNVSMIRRHPQILGQWLSFLIAP